MTRPTRLIWAALCTGMLGAACHSSDAPSVYMVAGPSGDDRAEFRPRASLAQYLELPNLHRELRITLSSYAASCEDFASLGEHGASISVSVLAPSGTAIEPGTFAWAGHAAHAGSEQQPEQPYALPSARIGKRSIFFEPGGQLELSRIPSEVGGKVSGLLAFEFAGDAEHPASSLTGQFSASLCRVQL